MGAASTSSRGEQEGGPRWALRRAMSARGPHVGQEVAGRGRSSAEMQEIGQRGGS